MIKHTPGPWKADRSGDARSKGYVRPVSHTDGLRLPAICRINKEGISTEEREANTRLIEAAPDLLHALMWLRAAIRPNDDGRPGFAVDDAGEVFAAMNTALAMAGVEPEATRDPDQGTTIGEAAAKLVQLTWDYNHEWHTLSWEQVRKEIPLDVKSLHAKGIFKPLWLIALTELVASDLWQKRQAAEKEG